VYAARPIKKAVRGENDIVNIRMENGLKRHGAGQDGVRKVRRSSGGQIQAALALSMASIATALLLGCSASSKPGTARASTQTVVPVGVATAQRRDVPVYLKGLGSVTASNTVSVKSRVDGQLSQVNFKEGQNVNKGDLLAVIDPRPFQVALSQAQANLYRDQAQLKDAQLNYERFKSLLDESGAISRQQVDTQKASADQMEGAVRADEAQIDNAKLNLAYSHITAPIGGRIGLRLVDAGNMVHAADTNPLLVITQLQPIAVIFTLPEENLQTVAKHLHQGPLAVEAYNSDDLTKLATGTLLTIDNQIDQTTGTGRLKAMFNNQDNVLWPNQFVNVRLLLETHKDSTVVPSVTIQNGPQGSYVFVVKADKTVEVRPVTVSFTQNNVASIASGINPGEVIVMDGQDKLQGGSKVDPHSGGAGGRNGQSSPAQGASGQSSSGQASSGQAVSGQPSPAQPSPTGAR
jgi:membrane fusion protein, multidrug efflux system